MSTLLESGNAGARVSQTGEPAAQSSSVDRRESSQTFSTAPLKLPDLAAKSAWKAAARLNANAVSHEEQNQLLRDRQILLDKMFSGSMTREDENKLAYIRWSLDRIEDARHGAEFDALENQAASMQVLLKEIREFYQHLDGRVQSKNR